MPHRAWNTCCMTDRFLFWLWPNIRPNTVQHNAQLCCTLDLIQLSLQKAFFLQTLQSKSASLKVTFSIRFHLKAETHYFLQTEKQIHPHNVRFALRDEILLQFICAMHLFPRFICKTYIYKPTKRQVAFKSCNFTKTNIYKHIRLRSLQFSSVRLCLHFILGCFLDKAQLRAASQKIYCLHMC